MSTEETRASILKKTWARAGGTEGEAGHVEDHHHVEVWLESHHPFSHRHTLRIRPISLSLNMSYLIGGVGRKGLLPTPDEFAAHYEGGRNPEGWEGGRDSGRTTVKQTKQNKKK